jgi:aspartyl-tRNA(Asn)/glutamyl-tRNA(Gln) amidotransferase subunit A
VHGDDTPSSCDARASSALERWRARLAGPAGALRAFNTLVIDPPPSGPASDAAPRPLDGLLVALKDNIDVAGLPTTNGLGAAAAHVAEHDATVVDRLRRAGAILIGKLNMHEAALGATSDNPHHGAVHNPWRLGYTAGGSSGGSGAAVAAGLCDLALGTDTLGSVRIPAAYCGVAGLKPTSGAVSTVGVAPLCRRLDQVGPLARHVADLGVALDAMAEPDAPLDGRPGEPVALADLSALVVGIPDALAGCEIDADVRRAFDAALDILRGLGATIRTVAIEGFGSTALRRAGLLVVEAAAAGLHAEGLRAYPEAYSPTLKAMLEFGSKASAERVARARRRTEATGNALRAALDGVDLVATPTAPQVAFSLRRPAPATQADLTAPASFAGCPALSVPCALSRDGLPVGLQLMGRSWHDRTLIAAGACFERASGFVLPDLPRTAAPEESDR